MCLGNKRMPIRFSFYNFINNDKSIAYGHHETYIDEITGNLAKPNDLLNNKGTETGTIAFPDFKVTDKPSFVEYLKDGWFLNLSVAIDFTASNKDLHLISDDKTHRNDYEAAIYEVGKVLEPYTYKQKFAGFGFGGIPRY